MFVIFFFSRRFAGSLCRFSKPHSAWQISFLMYTLHTCTYWYAICVWVCVFVLCLHSIGNFVVSLHVNFQCTVFTQRVYAAFGFSLPSVRAVMQIIDKNTRKKKLKKNTENSTEYPHICVKKDLCASLTNLLASEIINALQGLICSWPALWLLSLLSRVITEIEIGRRGGEKRDLLYVRLYFSLVCEIYGNFILNFR